MYSFQFQQVGSLRNGFIESIRHLALRGFALMREDRYMATQSLKPCPH